VSAPRTYMHTRIRAVVFDLFYTLVHPGSYPGGGDRVAWLAEMLSVDASALRARWDAFEPALEAGEGGRGGAQVEEDRRGPELAWLEEAAAGLSVPTIGADDLARIEADWDLTRREALLDPPAETLRALAGLRKREIPLGLLSNTHALELRSWKRSPLAEFFDVAAFSHEIGVCKPDRAAYEHVLTRLGVPAASAAYVGDGTSSELAGAKAAGFGLVVLAERAPALLNPGALPRLRAQADVAVSSLAEVADLVSC
jgi:putative hydrolase of the HAD superfamily